MKDLEVTLTMVPGTCDTTAIESIRQYSDEVASLYNTDLVVTAENVADAKRDLADLRKLDKRLKDERIARHAEYEKPYDDWYAQYKAATDPITVTIAMMDGKIKAYESAEEQKRISAIDAEILKDASDIRRGLDETVNSNPALRTLIFKPSYYNKSAGKIKSQEEWRTNLVAITRDLDVISASKDREPLMVAYLNSGNLAMAMQTVEEDKKRIASLNKQRQEQEEREAVKSTVDIVDIEPTTLTFTLPNVNTIDPADKRTVKSTRCFVGELYMIKELYKFALSIGIKIYKPKENN